jgi:hypothetical protein
MGIPEHPREDAQFVVNGQSLVNNNIIHQYQPDLVNNTA